MNATETFLRAESIQPGDVLSASDGFLARVVATQVQVGGDGVRLTLVPVYGSMTWPDGEERAVCVPGHHRLRVA